jgi:hypothetical protein
MGADQSKEPELTQLRNEVVELKSKLNGLMLLIAVVVPTATLAGYFICKAVCPSNLSLVFLTLYR